MVPRALPVDNSSGRMKGMAMKSIRVLLIDDHDEFVNAVEYFLKRDSCIEIAGRAASGLSGQLSAERLRPDVVVMDLIVPIYLGMETIRNIKQLAHEPKVIVVSMSDYSECRIGARVAGADHFIHKADVATQLLPAIYQLFNEIEFERESRQA
jgi:DNA-binding NarL/FixJ family response regulator